VKIALATLYPRPSGTMRRRTERPLR